MIYINDENKNYNNIENTQIKKNEILNNIKAPFNDLNNTNKNDNQNENDNNIPITTEKEYNTKDVRKLDIEDLVSYINEPKPNSSHKKSKKRKRKQKNQIKKMRK